MRDKSEQAKIKAMESLVDTTEKFIKWLDTEMKKPSTAERGSRIAQALNALETAKDAAKLHSGLWVWNHKKGVHRVKDVRP